MKISIDTVCYYAAGTIAETLESVAMQSHHDVENIAIDGSSMGNTLKIVERYADTLARAFRA
mgnify:CR=1 FL=1